MRVLAAKFTDRGRALAVRDLLRRHLRLGAQDVDVAPLGVPGESATDDLIVLAGHFPDEVAPNVAELVKTHGGEVVTEHEQRRTEPPSRTNRRVRHPPSYL